jgi:hypothetical protein
MTSAALHHQQIARIRHKRAAKASALSERIAYLEGVEASCRGDPPALAYPTSARRWLDTGGEGMRKAKFAARHGLTLSKSRRRDPSALDHGLYALIDPQTGGAVNRALVGQFIHSMTLDEVEDYLKG